MSGGAPVKKMADLLRAGATMLSERCPVCGLPLFRLRSGEVVCPVHGRVYIVRDESEAARVTVQGVLEGLERLAAEQLSRLMRGGAEPEVLREWLDVLERVERVLGMVRGSAPGGGGGEEKRGAGRRNE